MTNTKPSAPRLFYATFVVGLCALFLFYKYVLQIFPSIIATELMQTFSLSGAQLGNLAASFYYAYMITQLFAGILMDKFSTRKLTACAIACCAMGALLFSQMHSELNAALARGLMGAGVAFATISYLKMAAIWFPARYYALVSGLLATAAMTGAVFGQTPLALLMNEMGWRHCLFWVGICGLVLALVFLLCVRDTNKQSREEETPSLTRQDLLEVLKNKQNWLLTLYSGLAFSPLAVFGGLWGNPFLQQAYDLDKTQASTLISLIFIGLGVGSPLFGSFADRFGSRRMVLFSGIFTSLVAITILLYCTPVSLTVTGTLLFLFGFGTGAFMLVFTMGKETNKLYLTATVMAMINTSDAFLDALTEPLIGKLLDLSGSEVVHGVTQFSLQGFHIALSVLPMYLLAGIVLLKWMKEPNRSINPLRFSTQVAG